MIQGGGLLLASTGLTTPRHPSWVLILLFSPLLNQSPFLQHIHFMDRPRFGNVVFILFLNGDHVTNRLESVKFVYFHKKLSQSQFMCTFISLLCSPFGGSTCHQFYTWVTAAFIPRSLFLLNDFTIFF